MVLFFTYCIHKQCLEKEWTRYVRLDCQQANHSQNEMKKWNSKGVKLWPNGLASRRKLKTWIYLRPRLARPCVCPRWLALTLVEIKFARKWTSVFHRLATQPKSTQVEWRPLTYYQPMKYRMCLSRNGFFATCVYLQGRSRVRLATQREFPQKIGLGLLASPFGGQGL